MRIEKTQKWRVLGAIGLGLLLSIMSVLQPHVSWIAAFCGALGDGCHETESYHLLGIPIAYMGVLFYLACASFYFKRAWRFRVVMAGCGAELVFIRLMIEDQFFCVLCAANLVVVVLLFALHFTRKKGWAILAILLLSYTLVGALMGRSQGDRRPILDPTQVVLATVGGEGITAVEVEQPLLTIIHKEQQKIYALKEAILQARINDRLIERDAEAQGIEFEVLIAKIRALLPEPSQNVVDHYFTNGLYLEWGFVAKTEAETKALIRTYLHERDTNDLVLEYCEKLKAIYPVEIFLKAPPLPLTNIRIQGAPSLGPEDAAVTVVELSDYLCPVCRKGHAVVDQIKEKYAGQIRWVFKDRPLRSHPGARELALAARAAHQQNRFWDFQDHLFKTPNPSFRKATEYAAEIGLDLEQFKSDLDDPALEEALDEEIAEIKASGLSSTPAFLINGALHTGAPSFDEFCKIIDQALSDAGRTAIVAE